MLFCLSLRRGPTESDFMSHHIKCPSFAFPHAFLSKNSGASSGVYESLNCGPGSNDDPANVAENRRIAANIISERRDTPVLSCYQEHSPAVVRADMDWGEDRPKADAMVSNTPGLILGILTADCTPVLFVDEVAGVIGAAHAGWKGALTGVLENTIAEMVSLGANRNSIRTAIGPTIHQASYEVKSEFRAHFLEFDMAYASFFEKGRDVDHYQFDLPGFVQNKLKLSGINHIWHANVDTYKSGNHFSYRRTTHLREQDYGRQLSAIMIPV